MREGNKILQPKVELPISSVMDRRVEAVVSRWKKDTRFFVNLESRRWCNELFGFLTGGQYVDTKKGLVRFGDGSLMVIGDYRGELNFLLDSVPVENEKVRELVMLVRKDLKGTGRDLEQIDALVERVRIGILEIELDQISEVGLLDWTDQNTRDYAKRVSQRWQKELFDGLQGRPMDSGLGEYVRAFGFFWSVSFFGVTINLPFEQIESWEKALWFLAACVPQILSALIYRYPDIDMQLYKRYLLLSAIFGTSLDQAWEYGTNLSQIGINVDINDVIKTLALGRQLVLPTETEQEKVVTKNKDVKTGKDFGVYFADLASGSFEIDDRGRSLGYLFGFDGDKGDRLLLNPYEVRKYGAVGVTCGGQDGEEYCLQLVREKLLVSEKFDFVSRLRYAEEEVKSGNAKHVTDELLTLGEYIRDLKPLNEDHWDGMAMANVVSLIPKTLALYLGGSWVGLGIIPDFLNFYYQQTYLGEKGAIAPFEELAA